MMTSRVGEHKRKTSDFAGGVYLLLVPECPGLGTKIVFASFAQAPKPKAKKITKRMSPMRESLLRHVAVVA